MVSCFAFFCLFVPSHFLLQKIDIAEVLQPLFYLLDFMTNTCKLHFTAEILTREHLIDTIFWKALALVSHHFVCMEIFRKWRRWIGLKWNDDIEDKENEMQRLFGKGKDSSFVCNIIKLLLVSANIANEGLLFIPLISNWAICCWKAISTKISLVHMSYKGQFYMKAKWNSVRNSFRGRTFEDALG